MVILFKFGELKSPPDLPGSGPAFSRCHYGQQRPWLSLAHPRGQPPPQPQQHRHPSFRRWRGRQEAAPTQEEWLVDLRVGHHQATPGLPVQVCLCFASSCAHSKDCRNVLLLSLQPALQRPAQRRGIPQVEQQHHAWWRLSWEVWLRSVGLLPVRLPAGLGAGTQEDSHSHAGW